MEKIKFTNTDSALEQFSERIVDAMQDKLFENKSVSSGKLAKSIKVNSIVETNSGLEATIQMDDYGYWVDEGRRPSAKFPPPQPIKDWITQRGIRPTNPNITPEQLSYLIARKISKQGYKARPFIQPSVDLAVRQFGYLLENGVKEDLIKNIKIQ